ncbi:hypothetical protein HK101_007271 [Irineochytrium annulatum]|nr:hypothetical protein HK101_007271 [Irineochytrium annulatum]
MFDLCAPFLWSQNVLLSSDYTISIVESTAVAPQSLMNAALSRNCTATAGRRWKKYMAAIRRLVIEYTSRPVQWIAPWLVTLDYVDICTDPFPTRRNCMAPFKAGEVEPERAANMMAWINYVLELQDHKKGPKRIILDGGVDVNTARRLFSSTRVVRVGLMDVDKEVVRNLKPGIRGLRIEQTCECDHFDKDLWNPECAKASLATYISSNVATLDSLEIFDWCVNQATFRTRFLADLGVADLRITYMMDDDTDGDKVLLSEPLRTSLRVLDMTLYRNIHMGHDLHSFSQLRESDASHIGQLKNLHNLVLSCRESADGALARLSGLANLWSLTFVVDGPDCLRGLGDLIAALPTLRKLEVSYRQRQHTPPAIAEALPLRSLSTIKFGLMFEVVVLDWREIAAGGWPRLEVLSANRTALVTTEMMDGRRAPFGETLDRVLLDPLLTPNLPVVRGLDGVMRRTVLGWMDGVVGRKIRDAYPF